MRLSFIVLFLFGVISYAGAQAPQIITLQQAIDLALENNPALRQAENNILIQDANVRSAQMDFLPNLNAGFNGQRRTGRQFVQETLQFDDFTTNTMGGSISTNVVIFDGLRNIYSLRASQSARLSAEEMLERQRENVIFSTAVAYLNVILGEELLNIAIENLESSRQQLEQIEAQVEVGMRPLVDLYNQEALVARNEFEIVQQENSLNINKLNLIRIMAIDPLQEYDFEIPEIREQSLVMQDFSLNELVAAAMANRRDLLSTEIQITNASQNLRIARGAYLPTVSLSGSLSSGYSDQFRETTLDPNGNLQRQTVGFFDQFTDRNRSRQVGFNVQIPIFNRYNTTRQVQLSQIQYKNAVIELETKQLEVFQEVRQAYNDYIAAAKQLETTERSMIAATKAFETEQERFRVGASTLIELTRAQAEFVSASSNRVQSVYRFVFQEKLLEYYLGRISTEI
ncbi:MAG: TolC family protein [Bacteroidetes bacterium]|nr:TolC family protein [Bacteroidota bacterium]